MMKYKVLDEEGIAIRIFHSRYEAKAFLQEGWTIVPIKTKKIDPPVTAIAFAPINRVRSIINGKPADKPASSNRFAAKAKSTVITNKTPPIPVKTK